MRMEFWVVAILFVNAASAWSQEIIPALPPVIQASTYFQQDGVGPQPAPLENIGSAHSGKGNRWWGSSEALLWAVSNDHLPPLVTTGTTTSLGALGPGTTTIYGGNQNSGLRPGGRFTAGYWLDPEQTRGVEASFFFLDGPFTDNFTANSSGLAGTSVLARPYTNAITELPDSQLVGFPGVTSGSVHVGSRSQFFGGQVNGLWNLCHSGGCDSCCDSGCTNCSWTGGGNGQNGFSNQSGYRVDMIGGLMYLNLNEGLTITENITVLPTAPPPFVPDSTILVTDSFQTSNNFYGGQLGLRAERYSGAWFTNVSGQVALGDTHQQVTINGATVFTDPGGASIQQPGGLLALPTNMGTYDRNRFSVVPQATFNVGRQLTSNLRVYVGYTMLYWSNVVRPGDQIDPVVNPTQLPTPAGPGVLVGPARPAFRFHETSLWAQGLNVGMEFRY